MTDSNEPEPVDAEFEPADDGPSTDAPRRKAGFGGYFLTFFLAAVAGGALGASAAWFLDRNAPEPIDGSGMEARLAALESAPVPDVFDPTALEQRLATLENAQPPEIDVTVIEARLDALENAEPGLMDPAIPTRLIAVEERVGNLEAQAEQALANGTDPAADMTSGILSTLQTRLDVLEASMANPEQTDLAPVIARIEALETAATDDPAGLESRIEALETANTADTAMHEIETRLAALEATEPADGASDRDAEARQFAARTLGLLALTEMARTSQPFEAERAALARVWRGRTELDTLAAHARSGVADFNRLASRFPREAIEAAIGRRRVFFGLIELRPSAGSEASPLALVILVEERLAEGDLPGAVSLVTQLEGDALGAAQDWLVQAQARLTVDAALRNLRSALVDAAPPAEGDPT